MKELSASEITELVLKKASPEVELWRQNNISVKGRSFIGKKGIGDITGFHRYTGKRIEIEIKKAGDYLSEDQFNFLQSIHESNAFSYIVTQCPINENNAMEIHFTNDTTLELINNYLKENTKKIRTK